MRRIAVETLNFVRKNRYLAIDFVRVLKRALFVLFLENCIYLIFQVTSSLVPKFKAGVLATSMVIPIAGAVIYMFVIAIIMIIQMKKNTSLLKILKFIEFVLFAALLSRLTSLYVSASGSVLRDLDLEPV